MNEQERVERATESGACKCPSSVKLAHRDNGGKREVAEPWEQEQERVISVLRLFAVYISRVQAGLDEAPISGP